MVPLWMSFLTQDTSIFSSWVDRDCGLYLSVWSGAELSAPSRANPLEQLRELDP